MRGAQRYTFLWRPGGQGLYNEGAQRYTLLWRLRGHRFYNEGEQRYTFSLKTHGIGILWRSRKNNKVILIAGEIFSPIFVCKKNLHRYSAGEWCFPPQSHELSVFILCYHIYWYFMQFFTTIFMNPMSGIVPTSHKLQSTSTLADPNPSANRNPNANSNSKATPNTNNNPFVVISAW